MFAQTWGFFGLTVAEGRSVELHLSGHITAAQEHPELCGWSPEPTPNTDHQITAPKMQFSTIISSICGLEIQVVGWGEKQQVF